MALLGPLDALVSKTASRLLRARVRVELHPTVRAAAGGRLASARVKVSDIEMAGVRLMEVDLEASGLTVVPGMPPHVRARRIDLAVRVEQRSVDVWTRRLGLPARLVIKPSMLVARIGIGGLRLGQVEMDVTAVAGGIRLSPRRLATLGIDLRTHGELDVVLPLPNLPSDAVVSHVDWGEGVGRISLRVDGFDVPVTWSDVRRARALLGDLLRPSPHSTSLQPLVH